MVVSMKAMRVNRELTQREVAKKLGVARETLQKWEAGKTYPTAPQLVALCNIYGCKMEDIFLPGTLA